MLVDFQIEAEVLSGRIGIDPWDPERLQPASVDLTLDRFFRTYDDHKRHVINPYSEQRRTVLTEVEMDGAFRLRSQGFVLASTIERLRIPANMVGKLEGKSSLARLGIFVHVTAGFFDPGFEGFATLEMFNAAPYPILLYPGMPICQMGFDYSANFAPQARHPYSGKYMGQAQGPQESMYYKNFKGVDHE